MPFAVHIGPGVLQPAWAAGGFALLAAGVLAGLWRVNDREVPRVGVLTAAFFVASSAYIPFLGTSVHLLLNGLAGVVLRWRSPLAVAVGLTLQTLLLSHGGLDALGVNFVVLAVPAVLAGAGFRVLFRVLPAFAAGAVVGGLTATLTVILNAAVLLWGSVEPTGVAAGLSLLVHLPVIAVEAAGVGFACRVLAKANPEWLGVGEMVRRDTEGSAPP